MNFFRKMFLSDSDRNESEKLSKKLIELEAKAPEIRAKTLAIDGQIYDLHQTLQKAQMIKDYQRTEEILLKLKTLAMERDGVIGVWGREIDSIRISLERLTGPVIHALSNRIEGLMVEVYQQTDLTKIREWRHLKDLGNRGEKDITMIVCKSNRDIVEKVTDTLRAGQAKLRGMTCRSITEIEAVSEAIIKGIPETLEEKEFEVIASEFLEWKRSINAFRKETLDSYHAKYPGMR